MQWMSPFQADPSLILRSCLLRSAQKLMRWRTSGASKDKGKMASTALKLLRALITAFLIFIFFTAGIFKLTDRLSAKTHQKMKSDFVRFAKVHPATLIGYTIDPEKYMKQIGLIELAGATFLLMGPRVFKLFSCLLLSSVMIGAMYTLYVLADPIQTLVPAAVVLLALLIKLHFLLIGNESSVDRGRRQKTE